MVTDTTTYKKKIELRTRGGIAVSLRLNHYVLIPRSKTEWEKDEEEGQCDKRRRRRSERHVERERERDEKIRYDTIKRRMFMV